MQLNTQVSVLSPCELVLKVTQATISGDSSNIDTTDWTDLMTRNPLHFSWQDGKIPQICASNDDPNWVLNVKRGVLSTMIQPGSLQVNSDPITLSMTDVTGECEWSYDVTESNGVTLSLATKDYSKCQGRSQQLLLSHFNKYYSDSEQQSFVKSSQTCDQTIRDGAIIEILCEEEHVFVPFSKEDAGIRTRITQTSSLLSKQLSHSVDTLGESDVRRTSIVFEKEENSFSSSDISEVQSVVDNLCEIMGTELYSQVGEDFIKMVFLLRRLDPSALEQVHSSLDGACPVHEDEIKAMFEDALQWCGSEGCVVFAARMIERGEMTDVTATRWLTSMSLIAEPTIPMLRELTAVVRSGRLADKSYLAMGTMIHRLHATVDDCMSDPDVVIALELLERKLGVNCRTSNPEAKQEILFVLRAIGNAGGFTTPSILAECASETDNDMETRIAAVQAFRRMSCNTDRSAVSRLLFDTTEDSELRIGAYMALMQCPTPSFIKQVIQMLDNEPIQQVASFVWTHLQQLQESADPLKGYIKPLLVEAEFAKQYDLDPRKFSRFYEATLFSDVLNAGATVESSVVWSPKSFVPRSGSLDMTLDVFGQAVNLFEIGGRVEGVETLIQSFLGPKGYLKNNRLSDLFVADVEEEADEDDDEIEDPVVARSARSSSDLRLREIKQQHDSRVPTENKPSASWYLRLFGNEMYYKNTNGMPSLSAESESIDVSPILARLAAGSDFKYHDDMMLMNSAFVIPTIAGLPLTLAFNGTASIDVTANGHLDMTQFFTPQPTLDVVGSLKPRGVVLVTGAMSVDAHVTRIGLATESSAVTSWTLGGRLSVDQGHSVTVKVDAPYQRNTVFSFNHKLMKIVGNQKVSPNEGLLGLSRIESDCKPEHAGQRMCISNSMTRYPSEEVGSYVLPTRGPLTIDIYLEKTDTGFDHYLMQAEYSTEYSPTSEIPSVLSTSMVLDTPGSAVNRRTTVNLDYNTNDMTFNLDFTQPTQNVALTGNIENGLNRKEIVVTYRHNKDQTSFSATYEKLIELTETRWEVNTVLQMPSKTVNGHALMVLDPARKALLNLTIDNLMTEQIALNVALRDESAGSRLIYGGNGLLKIPGMIDSGVGFDINIKPKTDAFSFKLDYEFSGQEQQSIVFVHKRRSRSTSTVTEWEVSQKFTCTQYPIVNHHIFCNYSNGPGEISSYVKVGYGRHAGHDDNSKYISISQSFTKSESIDSNSLEGSVALRMPSFDMDYSAGLQHTYSDRSFNTALNLVGYEMSVMMEDTTQQNGGLLNYNMETQFPTPWGQIHNTETLQETQESMYHITSRLDVGSSGSLTLRGNIYFDNLDGRKRLESKVRGANDDILWHQRSIFEFLTPSGFLTQHSVVSQFNRLVNVSIRHEGQKQGGFETNVVAVYEPSILADLKMDFDRTETDATHLIRFDFLNELGVKRFLQLTAHKSAITTDTEGSYSGNFEFTTDVTSIPLKSVSGEANLETSLDSTSADGSLVVDESELLGFTASHSYSISDDLSGLRTVDITLRQRMCESTPNKMAISTSIQSTMNNQQTVTFNYHQDNVEKLVTSFQIATESQIIEGQASQHFSTDFPTEMTYVIRAITNGVNMRLGVDGRAATLEVAKASDSSLRLAWSHSLRSLRNMEVPTSIESTLSWGQQPSSGAKGAWMTGTVNRLQDFNAEALYNSDNQRVTFTVRHDVSSLHQFIPQIEAIGSSQITIKTGHIRSSIRVNSTEISLEELVWNPNQIQVRVHHAIPLLDSFSVPRLNELLMEYNGESMDNGRIRIVTDVDSVHSELILTSNPTVASIRYTSNCPVIGGDAELAYQKQTTDGSFTITYTRDGIEKSATIGMNYGDSSNNFNVNWNQNIITNEDYPMIPRTGSVTFSYTCEDTAFEVSTQLAYNEYQGEISTAISYPITKKKAVVSFEVTFGQNVFETAQNFHTILMARTDYSSEVFTSLKYTLEDDAERFVKLRLHLDDGVESGSGNMVVTARFTHNQPTQVIPRNVITTLTITPQDYGYETALSVTTNNDIMRFSLIGGFNPISNTVTVGYAQGIPYLTELGVFQNVTLVLTGDLPESDVGTSINGRFSLQIDDEVYSASASSGYEMGDSEITVTSDVRQQIGPLIALGVPKRVHKVSTLNYGLLDQISMSGALQLHSNVERTVYDLETDRDEQIQNEIDAVINVELFNWHVSFSGSHDFDFAEIPHNIQYEVAASGSTDGSPIFHKSLMMSVTLDGVKQSASVTMNQNKASNSFYLASKHNITKILAYGVPGNMSIDFQMNDNFDADLKIVYDTAKKSVGFKLDYDGNQKKLIFYFNHNFDMIVENWGVPKSMGFETQFLVNADNMQSMLKYVWGDIISKADLTSRWHASWDMPSLNIRMTQNMTTDEVFPVSITLDGLTQYNNQGFSTNIHSSRGYAQVSCSRHDMGDTVTDITCSLRQNFDSLNVPALSELEATYTQGEGTRTVEMTLSCDREQKLQTTIATTWNAENMAASLSVSNTQEFVENDVFPNTFTLYTNGSVKVPRFTAFTSLTHSNGDPFQLSVDTGYDIEGESAYVLIKHKQTAWKAVLPRTLRVDASYASDAEGALVTVVTKRGRKRNTMTAGYGYYAREDTVYGRFSYNHDLTEYQEKVPMHGRIALLLGKTENAVFGDFNVTMDDIALIHSAEANYNRLADSLSTMAEVKLNNQYLQELGVPHTVSVSASYNMITNFQSSASVHYGDKFFTVSLESDEETSAVLQVQQNFDFKPNDVRVAVTGSMTDGQANMEITIDDVTQDIVLSGTYAPGEVNMHLLHGFENTVVPNQVSLGGSYRFTPDIYVSAEANVDGSEYSVSGGFEKLANGFRVSSSLLDDISRSATFRQNMLPGGISFELDHTIPELDNYIPQSLGVSASARLSPRPNITASIRHENITQSFTAETDLPTLQFTLNHDVALLPIPQSITFKVSGSMNPPQGSIKVVIDGQTRTATAVVDPENLLASLIHNLPKLPLPESLTIEASGSMNPPSGSLFVTIDGKREELSASVNPAEMRGTIRQTSSVLSSLMIPNDIAFGVKGSAESMSGEIYISIDGKLRNVGGSVRTPVGIFSLFQSVPELESYLPRNITLRITGGMEPLQGSITLTMDEVERQVTGVVDPRNLLAALRHTVPEADEYFPRDLRASMGFTSESVQASFSYTKSNVEKMASLGIDFSLNHVRIQAAQTMIEGKNIPSQITVDLAGSIEYKNFTVMTEFDGSYFNLNGNILVGSNADGWYGITTSAQHNVRILRKKLMFPKNLQVEFKARKNGGTYETAIVLDLIKAHDYQGYASITPVTRENQFDLRTEYSHTYNGLTRSISGTVQASNANGCSLTVEGSQSSPEAYNIGFSVAKEYTLDETLHGRVTFSGRQNIPELVEAGVPSIIENGVVTFDLGRLIGNVDFSMTMDGEDHVVRVDYNHENQKNSVTMRNHVVVTIPNFNMDRTEIVSLSRAQDMSWWQVSYEMTEPILAREDNVVAKVYIDEMNPRITLKLKQKELNDLNVPILNELSFLRRDVSDNQIDWSLRLTCDERSMVVGLKATQSLPSHLDWNLYFDHDCPMLTELDVPTHAASKFNYAIQTAEQIRFDFSVGGELFDRYAWYNMSEVFGSTHGTATQKMSHNFDLLSSYLEWNDYVETYTYNNDDNILTLNGEVTKDERRFGTYSFTMNYDTKAIQYRADYDESGYEADYRFTLDGTYINLLISLTKDNNNNKFKIAFQKDESHFNANFHYDLYGPEITSELVYVHDDQGCQLNASTSVSVEEKTYSTEMSLVPVTSEEMKGRYLSVIYSVNDESSLTFNMLAKCNGGSRVNMVINLINNNIIEGLARRTKIVESYSPSGYNFAYTSDRKRIVTNAVYSPSDNAHELAWNFFQNVMASTYPRELTSSVNIDADQWRATFNADETEMFLFNVANQEVTTRIRTFTGNDVFSLTGSYLVQPSYQADISVNCVPLELNLHFNGAFTFMQQDTGNSSIVATLQDLNADQSFHFNVYAHPTGANPADLYGGLFVLSDLSIAPFTFTSSLNSTYDAQGTYSHDFQMQWNDNVIALVGVYAEQTFSLRIEQPWTETASTVILSGTNRSSNAGEKTKSMSVQWGGESDSFGVTMVTMKQPLHERMTMTVNQPSGVVGFQEWETTVDVDQTTANVYNYDFRTQMDGKPISVIVNYEGDLPQPLGHHQLVVTVTQPFTTRIPTTFVTTGIMTISSAGLYESDWRITSEGHELVALVKNYRPTAGGYNMDFMWKQSYVNIPGSFISIVSQSERSEGHVTNTAGLQVDEMPVMSSNIMYGNVQDDDMTNTTVKISLKTGPLSRFLFVRDFDVTSWYKYAHSRNREMPAFSSTMVVDGKRYHIDGSYNSKTRENDVRFSGDLTIQHPHQIMLFGQRMPSSNTGNFKLIVKPKGSHINLDYDNELMDNKLSIFQQYRVANGDRLLDYSARVKYSAEDQPDDLTVGIEVVRNDNNFDNTATINFAYPASHIDSQTILSGVNSESQFGTEIVFKNYDNTERKLWKLAVSYAKSSNIITVTINSPDMEETILRGDLSQVITQAGHLIEALSSEATSTGLRFIKGMTPTATGMDMYIGYQYNDGPQNTMHLIVGNNNVMGFALLEIKRDFVSQAKLGKISINLVDPRLVQIEMKTYPVVTDFLRQMFSVCDNEIARKINWLADELVDFLMSCKTVVSGSESVERMSVSFIDSAISFINRMRTKSVEGMTSKFNDMSNNFDASHNIIQALLRQAVNMLDETVSSLRDVVAGPFADLVDQHYGVFLNRIATSLKIHMRVVEDILSRVNADEVFQELVDEAVQKTSAFILANGEALFMTSRRPLSELIAVTESEVIINIPLEFELDHFVPLPSLEDLKTWAAQTALALKIDEAVSKLYTYVDQYYQVRAVVYMPRDELLPPFKGHAFVSGFRHFSTFDKRHIDFSSSCPTTHVLATDMRNDNFTITLSYGDSSSDSIPSIEMIVENRKVVVFSDYSVQVNGRTKDVPVVVGKIAVNLEGNTIHIRHVEGDVDVACDFKTQLCTVDVSPYYFGATGGLAGTYNNEPSDDVMGPALNQLSDVATMASQWETSDTSCASGNAYRPCASNNVPTICRQLFESTKSPFRSCFPLVDPKTFMHMCQDDMCDDNNAAKSCSAASAYLYRCKLAGAPLTMPDHCVMCSDVHGHEFSAARSRSAEITGVDLVFVVQESACMQRTSKAMRKFIKRLSSEMNSEGLRDSRFYMVGYGGIEGSTAPHTYTFSKEPFTTRKKSLYKKFRRMQLAEESDSPDALEAISYATKLPFRAGAKPIIVLMSCDECSSETRVSFGNVESQLKNKRIGFHHLPHHAITAGSKSMFGYDRRTAFSKHNLDSSVIKPSKADSCVPLATVTGGSVWDSNQLSDSTFQSRLGNYLARSAQSGTTVTCTCQMNEDGIASPVCTP
uniref:Uncharacterized protein LOC100186072 n=1 Tax=Phallusia mammillata TaxID=59560 RepID=A0A6F9DJ87_9ASCI|nr:uncharacterized protein LOC100186072 [Phallusia mammillata]